MTLIHDAQPVGDRRRRERGGVLRPRHYCSGPSRGRALDRGASGGAGRVRPALCRISVGVRVRNPVVHRRASHVGIRASHPRRGIMSRTVPARRATTRRRQPRSTGRRPGSSTAWKRRRRMRPGTTPARFVVANARSACGGTSSRAGSIGRISGCDLGWRSCIRCVMAGESGAPFRSGTRCSPWPTWISTRRAASCGTPRRASGLRRSGPLARVHVRNVAMCSLVPRSNDSEVLARASAPTKQTQEPRSQTAA